MAPKPSCLDLHPISMDIGVKMRFFITTLNSLLETQPFFVKTLESGASNQQEIDSLWI